MTARELERIARSISPPVGATMAIARVDEQLKHRAAFLIDGRIHGDPVGPAFDRPRDALRLVDLLNGEASRSTPAPDLARVPGGIADRRDEDPASSEAPDLGQALTLGPAATLPPVVAGTSSTAGTCAVCGRDLPLGSRPRLRTCSDACRVAAFRQRVAHEPTPAPVTVSERSEAAPDQSSRAGADTLRRQLEATDPTDLSNGQSGVPLSLGF